MLIHTVMLPIGRARRHAAQHAANTPTLMAILRYSSIGPPRRQICVSFF